MRMEDIDLGEDFDFEQMLNESFLSNQRITLWLMV